MTLPLQLHLLKDDKFYVTNSSFQTVDTRYPGNDDGFQYLLMNGNKNPGNKAYLVTSADFQGNTQLILGKKSLTITTLLSNPENSSQEKRNNTQYEFIK